MNHNKFIIDNTEVSISIQRLCLQVRIIHEVPIFLYDLQKKETSEVSKHEQHTYIKLFFLMT